MGEQNGQYGMSDIQRMMALVSGNAGNYDMGDWENQLRTWLDRVEAKQRPVTIDGIGKIKGAGFMIGGIRWEITNVGHTGDKYVFAVRNDKLWCVYDIELNRIPFANEQYELIYNGSVVDTINHTDLKGPHHLLAKIEAILSMI